MNELHKQPNIQNIPTVDERYRFLCVNKTQPQYSFNDTNFLIPEEAINALGELGKVLSGIHNRMKRDGYIIENGTIIKKV